MKFGCMVNHDAMSSLALRNSSPTLHFSLVHWGVGCGLISVKVKSVGSRWTHGKNRDCPHGQLPPAHVCNNNSENMLRGYCDIPQAGRILYPDTKVMGKVISSPLVPGLNG